MTKAIAVFLCVFLSGFCLAQDATTETDVNPKAKKKPKPPRKEMLLVNLNFDSWLGTPAGIESKWFSSRGVDVAILYDQVIARSWFSAAVGVGFNSHNIHMEGFPIEYEIESGGTYTKLDGSFFDGKNINVNKLSTNFIDIPIEVRGYC